MTTTPSIRRAVAALSAPLAVGCALLAVSHLGIDVPLLSRVGPGGDRVVVPAAVAFAVATLLLIAVATGAWRGRPWAWALGVVVHALVFLGAAVPFRGVGSAVAMVVTGVTVALLVSRPGRAALFAR